MGQTRTILISCREYGDVVKRLVAAKVNSDGSGLGIFNLLHAI